MREIFHEDFSGKSATAQLLDIAYAMLHKDVSYFEGAQIVLALRGKIPGIDSKDPDFNAFSIICSETDHLPLKAHHHLWNSNDLKKLDSDFEKTEVWASSFAQEACKNLISRFSENQRNTCNL